MCRKLLVVALALALMMSAFTHVAFAEIICKPGSDGEQVRAVQTRLYSLGYMSDAPVSPYKYDAATKAAVKKFQLATSLKATGVVDDVTYRLLTLSGATSYDEYQDAMHVPGGSGEEVKATKTRLKKLGYYTGALSVKYDEATEKAVTLFQHAHSLPATGRADSDTRDKLFSADAMTLQEYKKSSNLSTLKKGDKNEQVALVQRQLLALGYYEGAISSSFDAATIAAVKLFQEANGLTASGAADELTRSLLNSGSAKSYQQYAQEQSEKEVSEGDTGFSVTLLQERLSELAFYSGAINGKFSALVKTSVKRFQTANSVNASGAKHGVATTATRSAMNSPSAVNRYDSEGFMEGDDLPAVRELTTALKRLGYLSGVTSKYSAAVTAAVKVFQTANKLTVSGNATPATLNVLYGGSAISFDEYKNGSGNAKIEKVINLAMTLLGKPYKSPCSAPSSFDCSNFTKYCFKKAVGISLSGEVTTQANSAAKKYTKISDMDDLKRGDLLYFDTQDSKPIGHAAIYLGKSNGTPRFIHASSAKKSVVVSVFSDWYKERFLFGVRIWK